MFLVLDIEVSKFPHSSPWDLESFICSIGAETEDGKQYTWLLNHVSETCESVEKVRSELCFLIQSASTLVMHHAKFDLAWLRHIGVFFDTPVWCTMVGEYILFGQNPDVALSLNECCKRRYLPIKKDLMQTFWQEGYETNEIPWSVHKEYLLNDVRITKLLYLNQVHEVAKAKLTKLVQYTSELSKVFADMEYVGIGYDKEKALQIRQEYKAEAEEWELLLQEYADIQFAPSSPKQLSTILFGGVLKREVQELVARLRKNGTVRIYTRRSEMLIEYPGIGVTPHVATYSFKSDSYSTGKKARGLIEATTMYQKDFIKILDKWSLANKAWATILNEDETKGWNTLVAADGTLHPTFNQTVSRTGRLTSNNPNGQNLPRSGTSRLKELFVPKFDYILSCDLSQIEWRMAAALSGDKIMIQEIKDGVDIHTVHGEKFFGGDKNHPDFKKTVRQYCKTFNFRMIYNGGAKAFHTDPNMPHKSFEWWKDVVEQFWTKYKTLRTWQKKNQRLLDKQKYLRNVTSRILTFSYNCNPDEGPTGYNFNAVCNYPVQSVSADLMFIVLLEAYRYIQQHKLQSRMILQVHDSVVFDCPKHEVYDLAKFVLETMQRIPELAKQYYDWSFDVPITGEASVGKTYGKTLVDVSLSNIAKLKEVLV